MFSQEVHMLGPDRWLGLQQMEDQPSYWSGSGSSGSPERKKEQLKAEKNVRQMLDLDFLWIFLRYNFNFMHKVSHFIWVFEFCRWLWSINVWIKSSSSFILLWSELRLFFSLGEQNIVTAETWDFFKNYVLSNYIHCAKEEMYWISIVIWDNKL